MHVLIKQGIASEITGKSRGRLFAYDRYLAILLAQRRVRDGSVPRARG